MNKSDQVKWMSGRQLDAAIADEVLDLARVELLEESPSPGSPRDFWYSVSDQNIVRVPAYSQDIVLATDLLEHYEDMVSMGRDTTGMWRVLLGDAVGDSMELSTAIGRAVLQFERLAMEKLGG